MRSSRPLRAALLAATIALGVVPATAATAAPVPAGHQASVSPRPNPQLAGTRIQAPRDPRIFLIDPDGYRRWIPDPATYDSLFQDWDGVVQDRRVFSIAEGPAVSSGAYLAKRAYDTRVYLVDNGERHWITSPAAMERYHFTWTKIRILRLSELNAIPEGDAWS